MVNARKLVCISPTRRKTFYLTSLRPKLRGLEKKTEAAWRVEQLARPEIETKSAKPAADHLAAHALCLLQQWECLLKCRSHFAEALQLWDANWHSHSDPLFPINFGNLVLGCIDAGRAIRKPLESVCGDRHNTLNYADMYILQNQNILLQIFDKYILVLSPRKNFVENVPG